MMGIELPAFNDAQPKSKGRLKMWAPNFESSHVTGPLEGPKLPLKSVTFAQSKEDHSLVGLALKLGKLSHFVKPS